MAGTKAGGALAAKTNKEKYGADFYYKIGIQGGKAKSPLKGFGTNRDLARTAGALGGRISKRRKTRKVIPLKPLNEVGDIA